MEILVYEIEKEEEKEVYYIYVFSLILRFFKILKIGRKEIICFIYID